MPGRGPDADPWGAVGLVCLPGCVLGLASTLLKAARSPAPEKRKGWLFLPISHLNGLLPMPDMVAGSNFFNFNTFCKIILNLTLFFLTNTFGHAYFHGAVKCLYRAMHGGAAGG